MLTDVLPQTLQYIVRNTVLNFKKLPGYKMLKSYLICCVVWLETGDHVNWEMITVLDDTLLETTISINFRCLSLQP